MFPSSYIDSFNKSFSEQGCLYCAHPSCVNFDSARQNQIEAKRPNEAATIQWMVAGHLGTKVPDDGDDHSRIGKADEKDRFGKVVASQNSYNLSGHSITSYELLFGKPENPPIAGSSEEARFRRLTPRAKNLPIKKRLYDYALGTACPNTGSRKKIKLEKFDAEFKTGSPEVLSSEEDTFTIPITSEIPPSIKTDTPIHCYKILTGELCECPLLDGSEKLRENLATAKKIVQFVHDAIPFSDNYLQRSRIFRANDHPEDLSLLMESIDKSMATVRENKSAYSTLKGVVNTAKKNKVGRCFEMSAVGLDYVKEVAPVEMFAIKDPGDHVFLVIGRKKESIPFDYKNWGDDAVICDVWTGAFYPASQIELHLMDYVFNAKINKIEHALVQPFDPSRHTLGLCWLNFL